ncbi:MAG: hypothetical protein HYY20_00345 [Candidatus Tectomicrobia bacterium]|uniref:Dual OB-containing domain-containing protein n=1 Tax=Tectimicrobiota bacterium TaxID=2528274 RepID=A0A932CKZ0_UNCTE|nr:hypothetical protein [Candidatus Tectomicrobia bacterium]
MSVAKDLVILAVTKMHGGVCTAGIDVDGTWVRPVRSTARRVGECDTITDYCLLPIDFFHGGQSHLVNGGVSRIWLTSPVPVRPHIEDWMLDPQQKPRLLRKLSEAEQAEFFARHCDPDLSVLVPDAERSLGLFLPDAFTFSFSLNRSGTDIGVRAAFTIGGRSFSNIGCTDLRLRALGRRLLERSAGIPRTLGQADFERRGKRSTYLALGLSRRYHGQHWLIVVGVHTLPELDVPIDYGRL